MCINHYAFIDVPIGCERCGLQRFARFVTFPSISVCIFFFLLLLQTGAHDYYSPRVRPSMCRYELEISRFYRSRGNPSRYDTHKRRYQGLETLVILSVPIDKITKYGFRFLIMHSYELRKLPTKWKFGNNNTTLFLLLFFT